MDIKYTDIFKKEIGLIVICTDETKLATVKSNKTNGHKGNLNQHKKTETVNILILDKQQ